MSDQKDYSVFAGERFIESMRSNGYSDTSYAVAELVDNSIDAHAKHIDIICLEKRNVTGRYTLDKIAVLDDGHGMNVNELRSSLLFGDGTRGGNSNDIGRYGMGLPNSSLSQCKRVEVYSWKKSKDVLYTYLDVDEVRDGKKLIPVPRKKAIPVELLEQSRLKLKENGTVVIWTKLDRCSWVSARKIKQHSEFLIGRIYRRFLNKKLISINVITCKLDEGDKIDGKPVTTKMLPNDPMYLMSPSSTPGEWGKKAMFQKDTNWEKSYFIKYDGTNHEIKVRYSIEKSTLRPPGKGDQGSTKHGKHAAKNTGVSIMRADREVVLDTSLGTTSDPRDRWCGTEIDIPTSLDHVIGLTNNKQHVDILQSIMRTVGRFSDDDSERNDSTEEYSAQSSVHSQLFLMVREVSAHIRSMQRRIRVRRANTRKKGGKSKLGEKITGGIEEGQKERRTSQSDKDREKMSKEQRKDVIKKVLVGDGHDIKNAQDLATEWVDNDERVVFEIAELDGSNFFTAQSVGGLLRIKINSKHAAYKNLVLLTDRDRYKELTDKERLSLAEDGISLFLTSWARFENFIEDDKQKMFVQDIRHQWGRELDIFLTQNIA